jgi:NAD(P)-dependent dehydrogenase (short-subunit alcohol dehydrogenase family)
MDDYVVLVTGSTDGIGKQAARALAAAGTRVIVHGRSKAKVDAAVAELRAELPAASIDAVAFDLGSLAAIRAAAPALAHVTVLVNNAGLFAPERVVTADGIELTLAVNHVAAFLLAELIAAPRVINVASIAHTRGTIDLANVMSATGYTGYGAYATSKLANVMHALSLAERGRAAYSLHPGVIQTKLLRQAFGPVRGASPEVGAQAILRLATAGAIDDPPGTYYVDGVATPPSAQARDAKLREALWDATARLVRTGPGRSAEAVRTGPGRSG